MQEHLPRTRCLSRSGLSELLDDVQRDPLHKLITPSPDLSCSWQAGSIVTLDDWTREREVWIVPRLGGDRGSRSPVYEHLVQRRRNVLRKLVARERRSGVGCGLWYERRATPASV